MRVKLKDENNNDWYIAAEDTVFKSVLSSNLDLLKYYIDFVLNDNVSIEKVSITEVPYKTKSNKDQRLDLIVRLKDNRLALLEMNCSSYEGLNEKNLGYICEGYLDNLKKGEDYKDIEDVIQCNFTYDLDNKLPEYEEYFMLGVTSKRIWSYKMKIIEFNMSKILKTWYNNHDKKGKYSPPYCF